MAKKGGLGVHEGMKSSANSSENTGVKNQTGYSSVDGFTTRKSTAPTPKSLGGRKS